MKIIATINGISVYSDKQLTGISGTRISFADGSSCDIGTKSVDDRGPGSIQIGEDGTQKAQENATNGPTRFSTTSLQLSGLTARLVVEPWDRSDMELTVSGPKDELESIVAKPQGSVLSIEGRTTRGRSRGVHVDDIRIETRCGSSRVCIEGSTVGGINISGGSVIISGGANRSSANVVTVSVKVPRGAGISLDGLNGNAEIGDVDGALDVRTNGLNEVRTGRMRTATISASGNSSVRITEVNGQLSAQTSGLGCVKVKAGAVSALNVQASGSSQFCFDGAADTAILSVSGMGKIDVAKVKAKPIKRRSGMGEINVG